MKQYRFVLLLFFACQVHSSNIFQEKIYYPVNVNKEFQKTLKKRKQLLDKRKKILQEWKKFKTPEIISPHSQRYSNYLK